MERKTLPIIDLQPFHSSPSTLPTLQQLLIAKQLCSFCQTLGFFYIKNHNVSPKLLHKLQHYARSFFAKPTEEKESYSMSRNRESLGRGYQRVGENVTNGGRDQCEAFDMMKDLRGEDVKEFETELESRDRLDEAAAQGMKRLVKGKNLWWGDEVKKIVEEYCDEMRRVGRYVMRAFEIGLGAERGTLEDIVGDEHGFWIVRMILYPASKSTDRNTSENEEYGCGSHADYGFLTFVLQDDVSGCLKAQGPEGSWIFADPVPGTFVVNIGDCLESITHGALKSTLHRVERPVGGCRLSIPCFIEPRISWKAKQPAYREKKKEGATRHTLLGCRTYGEYLYSKVSTNFEFDEL